MNFVSRPKVILMSFLKAFFSQKILFNDIVNEFVYIDNIENDSLIIRSSYAKFDENINSFPCIVIQEGGFREEVRSFGNRNTSGVFQFNDKNISTFVHPITIHCLTANKGSAEMLQALVAKSIITFRKAIYELGLDHITSLDGMPCQMLTNANEGVGQYFNAPVNFSIYAQQNWVFTHKDDPEEIIKISISNALNELEYDEAGNITSDPSEYMLNQVKLVL